MIIEVGQPNMSRAADGAVTIHQRVRLTDLARDLPRIVGCLHPTIRTHVITHFDGGRDPNANPNRADRWAGEYVAVHTTAPEAYAVARFGEGE